MILKQVVYYEDTNSIEATWVNSEGISVKCQSYSGDQMSLLAEDLGSNADAYTDLMNTAASRVQPYFAPVVIPYSVTPFQAKAAMLEVGILSSVLSIINDNNTPALTKLAWENVTEFTRDSPLLNGLASTLGLTSEQVDELFIAAAQIEI